MFLSSLYQKITIKNYQNFLARDLKDLSIGMNTRDNVLLDPRQRLFNNFEKVQFWAKFELLTPMRPGQEFSQR